MQEDLERLTDAELYRLRTHWARRLPSELAVDRIHTIDQVLAARHRKEKPLVELAGAGLVLTDSLAQEIELACYAARLAWRPRDGHISRIGATCILEKTETGKLIATLTRDGDEPVRRLFTRRFDDLRPWEEVDSAKSFTEAKLYDDRMLALELAAWMAA